MQIGTLYPYEEKQFEKAMKEGKAIGVGIEVQSLLDELGYLEAKHCYNLPAVLGELKMACLITLGKLKLEEKKEEEKKEEEKGGEAE